MLGSVVFTGLLFLTVLPYSLMAIFARLFGASFSYRVAVAWARLAIGLCQRLCGLGFSVQGQDNIPAANSVVLVKHSSAYETMVTLLLFPQQTWVLKRELMWAPFFGWALTTLRPIAIDRGGGHGAVEQVVAQGTERLNQGYWIMIFPEGTRMPPGETRRYGLSGALLAQSAGRLLVPVAHNAGDFWPRRGLRKRPGTVRFHIGRPVDPAGRDVREVNSEIQRWMEATVAELRADARRA
jgi:1-acyl-sn-glycerol-3-phosphate acyltransferase